MLIYPLDFDRFGQAARAVFHGVALRGDFRKTDVRELRQQLRNILTHPYRLQAHVMCEEFGRAEKTQSPADYIELLLGTYQVPTPSPNPDEGDMRLREIPKSNGCPANSSQKGNLA